MNPNEITITPDTWILVIDGLKTYYRKEVAVDKKSK